MEVATERTSHETTMLFALFQAAYNQ